jgi:hypothetical protein
MGVQNPNSTNYVHPDEPNLLNLHKAMTYDPANGEPHLRVTLGSDNITVSGNVNLVESVRVNNTEAQMIPVYLVGNVLTVNQGTTPWYANANVIGNISGITTLPAIRGNVGVSGNINVDNFPSNVSITQLPAVSGNVWVNGVSGNISGITTLPAITGNVGVSGNVDIGRMPGVTGNVGVSGNVEISRMPAITGNVNITQLPALGNVSITQLPAITGNVGVSGNVSITQMPAVSGNVSISQMPAINGNVVIADGGNSITVDGNVSITQMPAITGTVTMITDANAAPVVSFADTIQMDSVNRLRVSVNGQQWWYVPAVDKDGDLRITEKFQGNVSGNVASSTFIQNLASVRLSSGLYYNANTSLTGTAIRASRRRHKTRPGSGHEWIGIVNWDGLQDNVVKRIGMFTNFNGVFFEANATTVNAVVRRRLTDNTLVETRVPHTAWSEDTMDGTGPTGYNWLDNVITANVTGVVSQANVAIPGAGGTIYQVTYQLPAGEETRVAVGKKVTLTGLTPTSFNDTGLVTSVDTANHRANVAYVVYPGTYSSATNAKFTNTPFHAIHSYWFDFAGGRTGRVRFGMQTDRGKVCVHQMTFGEIGSQWASAPALMDRKEIINTGQPVAFLPSMTIGGSAVTIETQADINPGFGTASTSTPVAFNKNSNVGSEFAVIGVGIRPGEPYQRADLQVNDFQVVDLGNLNPQNSGIFQWRLVLNPTTSNAATYTDVGKATHRLTYAAGTTATGGITLLTGYAQGTFTGDTRTALNFLNMGSNIDYTSSDEVVLMVKLLVGGTDNSSVMGIINYTEDL